MGKFRGLDAEEGWIQRRFAQVQKDLEEQAAARRLVIAVTSVQVDLSGVALPTSFSPFAATAITVPQGFTHAIVNLFASCGTTFNVGQTGNVGVQPVAAGVGGSAISQGATGIACSVNSTQAATFPVSGAFNVLLNAYSNGGTRVAGSDNVHLSGSIMFVRL